MRTYPVCEPVFDDTPAAGNNQVESEGSEVLLHRFLSVLNDIEPQIAQRMREEITSRFGGRYCSDATCAMMAELVTGYLANGQRQFAPVRS